MIQANNAQLIISAAHVDQFPDTLQKEIVLAGRSNVGKSSFINALAQRKKLAYVGQRPGKTRLLNFYQFNDELMVVDVPGYGYANRSKTEQKQYGVLMDGYFSERHQCVGAIVVIDARRGVNEDDQLMIDFLLDKQLPLVIVLSKTDKLSRSQMMKVKKQIENSVKCPVCPFSSLDKQYPEEIGYYIERMI